MALPQLLALDFDGVICDGLIEYFQTAWRAYCLLFEPESDRPSVGLAEKFYPLRPVIETGWEMPILVRSLIAGDSSEKIIANWPQMALPYLEAAGLEKSQSVGALDGVRDKWIKADLQSWLSLHRFYPGMIDRLRELLAGDLPLYIVSTKEGRFIKALLAQSGIDFPTERIIGKEVKRPKYETLRLLKEQHSVSRIWFVEDRLPALTQVKQQNDLTEVQLFLADWGYNLEPDRETARQDSCIRLLSLEQIVQPFDQWTR
ncbi:MAG: haloacid dehalogenase [Leptolyngbya foveolarum]|uniref:Haloacid dehalogenase n=1 Tax=Leptolyngbya foveolarum TaxID=47253 RepID=A0A2W4TR77_9CYAN|nr:MAG: haloacid dehalogenase [Leptolyngbya foveolarum]